MVSWEGISKKKITCILNKNVNTRQKQRLHITTFSAESELSEDRVGPG